MRQLWAFSVRIVLVLACVTIAFDLVVLGLRFPFFGWLALAAASWRITRRGWPSSGSHGTATTAGLGDLLHGKLLADRGLVLGRLGYMPCPTRGQAMRSLLNPFVLSSELACRQFFAAFVSSRWMQDGFIRVPDFVHLATFAPAGGGKSVSVLGPNLLSYAGNCVVIDPKGELYKLTAKHRKHAFGHKIVRLDPALLMGPKADCFNPFDFVDAKSLEFGDVCRDLANMLVVRTGKELDPHWCDAAENVICAFIAYICALEGNPAARNLRGMRSQIASRTNYTEALETMRQQEGFHGVLEQFGEQLGWHVDKELGSVMSHAQRFTNIFDAPLVATSTSRSSFDPRQLRTGRMTIYLIVPADRMVTWSGLQRLWLGCLLRIITRGVPTEKNPVLFMVDECAHIGKMQALEDAVTLLRGAGIRMWMFFQSIEQLKKCFGDNAGTVLDNLATQQYFAINSYETAEAVSKRIGDETIFVTTEGGNDGTSTNMNGDGKNPGSRNSGSSRSTSATSRRLMKPEEILTARNDVSLVFHKNHPVIVAQLIKYFSDKAFRRRGLIFRSWGTGRSRGLGLGGMVLALAALLLGVGLSDVVATLPGPGPGREVRHTGGGYAGNPGLYNGGSPPPAVRQRRRQTPGIAPYRVGPGMQPWRPQGGFIR